MEKILKSTIVGTLNYGNDVYGGSSLSTLKSLNLCLNQGIRKVTGTFRSSPVKSLYAESGMLTLKNSREVISTQNMFKFLARPHQFIFDLLSDDDNYIKSCKLRYSFLYRSKMNLCSS